MNWKSRCVLLLDNAPYHQGRDFKEWLSCQGVAVMFTAPYSFDACPIELLFGELKRSCYVKMAEANVVEGRALISK